MIIQVKTQFPSFPNQRMSGMRAKSLTLVCSLLATTRIPGNRATTIFSGIRVEIRSNGGLLIAKKQFMQSLGKLYLMLLALY